MTTTQHAAFILQVFQQTDTGAQLPEHPKEAYEEREKILWLYREKRAEGQSFSNALQNAKTTWLTEYLAKMAQQWPSSGHHGLQTVAPTLNREPPPESP